MKAEVYAFASVLTMCACTPPLPEVLQLWDFLFAYGPHLNVLCICVQLLMMKERLLGSPRYVFLLAVFFLSGLGPDSIAREHTEEAHVDDADGSSISPGNMLRNFPHLKAKDIITGTVNCVRKIPNDLYEELVHHME